MAATARAMAATARAMAAASLQQLRRIWRIWRLWRRRLYHNFLTGQFQNGTYGSFSGYSRAGTPLARRPGYGMSAMGTRLGTATWGTTSPPMRTTTPYGTGPWPDYNQGLRWLRQWRRIWRRIWWRIWRRCWRRLWRLWLLWQLRPCQCG